MRKKSIIEIGDVLEDLNASPTEAAARKRGSFHEPCFMDLQKFLVTRAFVQAESGSGKSWFLRRLAEQSYSFLPPIILDPEGEFASLREKDDYIIAAPAGADAVANASTASLLALRILETRVAAVIDIFEMSPDEQRVFVQRFFDALTNAPKKLWTPRLVILDEVQLFAQEGDKGACSTAVANASTRWRKRGFVLVAATQRIANVSKDVTAGLKNKFIGGTSQDIDVARAAKELGIRDIHAATQALRRLEPGEFYCYGPALSHDVRKIRVGPVETSHPEAGKKRMKAPPPPSAKVKAILAALADLPKEAETEAKTAAELRELLKTKDARIRELEKAAPPPPVVKMQITDAQVKKAIHAARKGDLAQLQKLSKGFDLLGQEAEGIKKGMESHVVKLEDYHRTITLSKKDIDDAIAEFMKYLPLTAAMLAAPALESPVEFARRVGHVPAHPPCLPDNAPRAGMIPGTARASADVAKAQPPEGYDTTVQVTPARKKILDGMAKLERLKITGPHCATVAAMAGFRPTGGTYGADCAALLKGGFVTVPAVGHLALTTLGWSRAETPAIGFTAEDLRRAWLDLCTSAQARILQVVIDQYPKEIYRVELAAACVPPFKPTGGTYGADIAKLASLGAVEYPRAGFVKAATILFPDR